MNYRHPRDLSYFFGRLTKKESEDILNKSVHLSNGKFILRERIHEPGSFVLAIYVDEMIDHIYIDKLPGGYLEIPKIQKKFKNGIHECMEYLMENETNIKQKPSKPHPRLIYSDSIMLAEPVGYLFLDTRSLRDAIDAKIKSNCRSHDLAEARGKFYSFYENMALKDIHLSQKWFKGRLNRHATEKLFQQSGHKNGKFLLRRGFYGHYKLSLSFNSRTYHHKIYHSNDLYYISNSKREREPNESFNYLMQLIDYYGREKGMIECELTEPVGETFDCDTNNNYKAIMKHNGFELERGTLVVTDLLNSSESVQVFRGVYKAKSNKSEKKVALKIITDILRNEKNERNILSIVSHKNIVKTIDLCDLLDKEKIRKFLILEYAPYNSLDFYLGYLKDKKEAFNLNNNLRFIKQLASALEYLADHKIVHRNIASCNVLVFKPDLVKLCDFSHSKELKEDYYRVSSGAMSTLCKRQPPEVLRSAYFSEKSDVWSFGVLMWEILSYGAEPHSDIQITTNAELQKFADDLFEQKVFLRKPDYCSNEKLNYIISICCKPDRKQRVTFENINEILEIISTNKLINKTLKNF